MVVDASVAAALAYFEAEAATVRIKISDSRLVAPPILRFELANVCLTKQRKDPTNADQYRAWFFAFQRVPIEMVDVDFAAVLDLAARFRLTAYDASYLALALDRSEPLFTFDRRLAAAAEAAGI